jgi:hypothetical protein
MKFKLLKVMMITLVGAQSAISYAGFLNDIDGDYQVKGKNCNFETTIKLTGKARINSSDSGAVVSLEVIISNLKTEIPFSFLNGKGDKKKTAMEGDVIRLPVTKRVIWETNEAKRTSAKTEFEGILISKKTSTTSLAEMRAAKLFEGQFSNNLMAA